MQGKWTPGPWLSEDGTVYVLQHDEWVKGVEKFRNRFSFHVSADRSGAPAEEIAAIVSLTKAAPDLYAALEEIVALTDRKTDIWDKARAALAKARGEA